MASENSPYVLRIYCFEKSGFWFAAHPRLLQIEYKKHIKFYPISASESMALQQIYVEICTSTMRKFNLSKFSAHSTSKMKLLQMKRTNGLSTCSNLNRFQVYLSSSSNTTKTIFGGFLLNL